MEDINNSNLNCLKEDQYERIQGAILKSQNKNYSVFKGVNTVGRNKMAIINLKNLNVSQNHAVIIIIDDVQHFISDLNSSNGTYLLGCKLLPFKLYELVNDVEIKFGDVSAIYYKMPNLNRTVHLEMENADMTQNMTQNFYNTATQQMINESFLNQTEVSRNSVLSQCVEDIHEAATQVVVYPPRVTENTNCLVEVHDNDIHEAATQVVDYNLASTSGSTKNTPQRTGTNSSQHNKANQIETDIQGVPKQVDNVSQELDREEIKEDKASQLNNGKTFEMSAHVKTKNSRVNENSKVYEVSTIEETVIEETVMEESLAEREVNENSNDSIDFLAIPGNENLCSERITLKNDENLISHDSPEIGARKKHPARKLSSSEDTCQPRCDNISNSDSDTDIEDHKYKNKIPISTKKLLTNTDSDTEVEDIVSEFKRKSKVLNSDSETDIEDNKVLEDNLTQSQEVIKPKILSKKKVLDSDSDTDIEEDIPIKEKSNITEATQQKNTSNAEVLNESDFIPATQDAFSDIFMYKNTIMTKSNVNSSSQNVSSEESFKLGLTELMAESIENKIEGEVHEMNKINIPDKVSNTNYDNNPQGVVLKPTEQITEEYLDMELSRKNCTSALKPSRYERNTLGEPKEKVGGQNAINTTGVKNDICLMPTQEANKAALPSTSSLKNNLEKDIDEDFYNMPTQNLNEKNTQSSFATLNKDNKNDDDDFYMMPTQSLTKGHNPPEFRTPKKMFHFRKKNVKLDVSLSNIFAKNQVDIKDRNEDIYLQPTQKLNEEVNLQPAEDSNKKFKNPEKNTEDEFYMAPTQKISVNKVEQDISIEKTEYVSRSTVHKIKFTEPDTTFEITNQDDPYMAATQPLNLEIPSEKDVPSTYKEVTKVNQDTLDVTKAQKESEIPVSKLAVDLHHWQESKFTRITNTSVINKKPGHDDTYMMSTQQVIQELVEENKDLEEGKETSLMAVSVSTKPSNSKTINTNGDDDNHYMMSTQQVILELVKDEKSPAKISTNSNMKTLESATHKNDDDSYVMSTQQVIQQLSEENKDSIRCNKEKTPGCGSLSTKHKITENCFSEEREVEPDHLMQKPKRVKKINNEDVETLSQIASYIKQPEREVESDQIVSKPKGTKKIDNEDGETLSQIDSFIKQPATPLKRLRRNVKDKISKEESKKTIAADPSETLSQIQRFIIEPFDNSRNGKAKAFPEKKEGSSCHVRGDITSGIANVPDDFETLSQIDAFIKKPSNIDKENKIVSKLNEKCYEAEESKFSKPEQGTVRSRKTKSTNQLSSHVSKKELGICSKTSTEVSTTSNDVDNNQDSDPRNEIEQSFALLEAKSTKTRKSQRITNSAEIKTLCKNRRSMAITVVPETPSISVNEIKPSTRKSRKKSTNINNNDQATVSTKPETKVSGRAKRKHEPLSTANDTGSSETSKPNKLQKLNTKKNKSEERIDAVFQVSSPSTIDFRNKKKVGSNMDEESNTSHDSGSSTPSRRGRRNIQNASPFSSSEKTKRKLKPKVVFTMLDSPLLESLIRQMGGSVVDTVEFSTVLITEQVKRSQKLLTAIGLGKPICSPQWIHASKKANEFLDPWEFILCDKEAESKWKFSLKESITRANKEKLLANYTFLLMVNNAIDVLKAAIEACGGKCVSRHPAKTTEGYFVIVASPENKSKYSKVKKQHPQVTVVEPEAIFDGVLRQELQLGRHLLT